MLVVPALALLVVGACDSNRPAAPPPAPVASAAPPAAPAGLQVVADRSLVCMVNDTFMGRPQIPVDVGGKTYFGCCEACKGRLASDAAVRQAVDPVTQAPVDKATAVIAQRADGTVLYFASEDSLRRFTATR
jgi:YHS domain-containing protein